MTPIFDAVLALYGVAEWTLEPIEGETIASITYQSGPDAWVLVAATNEDLRTFVVFARSPESCPPSRVGDVVDLFNRLNFGMTHGAWVVDPSDGEIRFRVGVDLAGRELAGDELGAVTNYVNVTMDTTLAALRAVIAGDADTDSAFAMIFGTS